MLGKIGGAVGALPPGKIAIYRGYSSAGRHARECHLRVTYLGSQGAEGILVEITAERDSREAEARFYVAEPFRRQTLALFVYEEEIFQAKAYLDQKGYVLATELRVINHRGNPRVEIIESDLRSGSQMRASACELVDLPRGS